MNQGPEDSSDDSEEDGPYDLNGDFEGESLNLSVQSVKSKRGRKPIPEMWSRVLWLGWDNLENLKTYELGPDLLLGNAMIATVSRGKKI